MEQNKPQGDASNAHVDENTVKNATVESNSGGHTTNSLLSFLLFFKNNLLLILGFTIVGAALGWFLGKGDSNAFTTTMRVEPNFNSTPQLTSQIEYYESLINDKDVAKLGKELGITSSMATSIATLQIAPYKDKIAMLNEYEQVTKSVEGNARPALSFEAYQAAKKDTDFSFQIITATGSNPVALNKLMDKLIALEPTTAIAAAKTAAIDATWYKLTSLDNHTRNVDSLMNSIRRNINNLGQNQESTLESLFREKQYLVGTIDSIRTDWNKYQNTINVVSRHTKQGVKAQSILITKGALLFFLIGLLVAGLMVLWKSIKEYELRHNA